MVSLIVTEFAVFSIEDGTMTLLEIAPEVTKEDVRSHTEANYVEAENITQMKGTEVSETEAVK